MANVSTIRMPQKVSLSAIGMGKKTKHKAARTYFFSGKTALVSSLVICLLSLVVIRGAISKSECNVIAAERQNKKLLAENRSLQREWKYLKSPSRMERLAKRELGLKHPSKEQLIVIR